MRKPPKMLMEEIKAAVAARAWGVVAAGSLHPYKVGLQLP